MVFASRITVLLSCLFFQLASSIATVIRPLSGSKRGIIPALLEQNLPIVARDPCPSGYNQCNNGAICCPTMTFCVINSGKPSCCPVGSACIDPDLACVDKDYVVCPGDAFCCPAGDTCSRDTSKNPKCSSGFIPGGVTTTQSATPTATTQSTASIVSTTSQIATPSSTTSSPAVTSSASRSIVDDSTSTTAVVGQGVTLGDGALANTMTCSSVLIVLASIIAILV